METYVINYSDQVAMALELDEGCAEELYRALMKGDKALVIKGVGFLNLQDIRSVIKQKPIEENPSYSGPLSDEEKEYIANQEKWEEYLASQKEEYDDADFSGGDI